MHLHFINITNILNRVTIISVWEEIPEEISGTFISEKSENLYKRIGGTALGTDKVGESPATSHQNVDPQKILYSSTALLAISSKCNSI